MENEYEEQPKVELSELETNESGSELGESNENETEGSSFGKFKTANDLLNAYNNLQAEFTRRCQRIKSLEKELQDYNEKDLDALNTGDEPTLNESTLKTEMSSDMADDNNKKYDTASNEKLPSYLNDNFSEEVANFLNENKNAKQYAKEIGEEILKDKTLTLQSAYDRVLAKMYKNPSELATDDEFINNYILSNDAVLKNIIKKYKSEEQKLPKFINNENGNIAQAYPNAVSTIKEAGELAYKLFS